MAAASLCTDAPVNAFDGGVPVKRVTSVSDMQFWLNSEAYFDVLGFINGISTAIQGKCITDDMHVSDTVQNLINIFGQLEKLIDETPPIDQPQRFGNKSFRAWFRKMNHDIFIMLQRALSQDKCHVLTELGFFLSESFGNSVRIDYGTGHELSFLFFLCALFKAEILVEADNVACALRLFNTYLQFVRRLQQTYRMEPAGSQGVWSLDDYQFVPFIWGSAQLAVNAPFDPAKFLDDDIIEKYKTEYLYISCIDYIREVKTGHFAEHSNQLWSISAVPMWSKINTGLVKMYQKEIMSKFPIIQHVYFGNLMSFAQVKPGTMARTARLGIMPAVKMPTLAKPNVKMLPPPAKSQQEDSNAVSSQNSTVTSNAPTDINVDTEQCDVKKDQCQHLATNTNPI